jgi:hypothetical protein
MKPEPYKNYKFKKILSEKEGIGFYNNFTVKIGNEEIMHYSFSVMDEDLTYRGSILLTEEEILEEVKEESKSTWSEFVKNNIYNTPYDDVSSDPVLEEKCEQIKKELSHIQKPYTLEEVLDIYSKSGYNPELLLQHALLLLLKD